MAQETYGQQVARLRDERGWTQDKLAAESGVPKRTLQDVELDKGKPQRGTRLKLNMALGIEGDAATTRSEWPTDVQTYLDILGAFFTALPESERVEWMSRIAQAVARRESK